MMLIMYTMEPCQHTEIAGADDDISSCRCVHTQSIDILSPESLAIRRLSGVSLVTNLNIFLVMVLKVKYES